MRGNTPKEQSTIRLLSIYITSLGVVVGVFAAKLNMYGPNKVLKDRYYLYNARYAKISMLNMAKHLVPSALRHARPPAALA